jgi:hypothetical protein
LRKAFRSTACCRRSVWRRDKKGFDAAWQPAARWSRGSVDHGATTRLFAALFPQAALDGVIAQHVDGRAD